jgi:hypothetical protein
MKKIQEIVYDVCHPKDGHTYPKYIVLMTAIKDVKSDRETVSTQPLKP